MQKAKVGDYVKVIKKLPYKDDMGVEIGDIGVVNYVASTDKYSVHIDGKKNPKDIAHPKLRAYGQIYDFWIPHDCVELIDLRFKIGDRVKIYKPNTVFHNKTGVVKGYHRIDVVLISVDDCKPNSNRKDGCRYFDESKLFRYVKEKNSLDENALIRECLFEDASVFDKKYSSSYYQKESEETKMETKKIRNVEVVDMFFDRKRDEAERKFAKEKQNILNADPNRSFAKAIENKLKDYIAENDLKVEIDDDFIKLPLTKDSEEAYKELCTKYEKQWKIEEANKNELLAMLSGCDKYEQEMIILKSYGVIGDDNKMTQFEVVV